MLTPVQRQLCEEWRGLVRAAGERVDEIARVEQHLAALKQAHRRVLQQAEALGAFLMLADLRQDREETHG
jgi:hypothetical protein